METLLEKMDNGSQITRQSEGIISTLLTYIQDDEIVVPIADLENKKFYGIVTGKTLEGKYKVSYNKHWAE
jgi:hypothetical protein